MRSLHWMTTLSIGAISFVAMAGNAMAIALPDNSSANCGTANGCFRITNTNTGTGAAITGILSQIGNTSSAVEGKAISGAGVRGSTSGSTGWGVIGSASSAGGIGVQGSNTSTGVAISASSIGGKGVYSVGATEGVYGQAANNTATGVYGFAPSAGTGNAIFGDAQGSFSAWAGNYDGDVQARAYYNSSDARLKKDIKDASYGVGELMKLRPVSYKWKAAHDSANHNGFLAQEVQKIFPEAVRVNGATGMLAVDYTALIPVAIRAIQQQEARIKELESSQTPLASSALPLAGLGGWASLVLLPIGIYLGRRPTRRK
jgi:hypothetical protein